MCNPIAELDDSRATTATYTDEFSASSEVIVKDFPEESPATSSAQRYRFHRIARVVMNKTSAVEL